MHVAAVAHSYGTRRLHQPEVHAARYFTGIARDPSVASGQTLVAAIYCVTTLLFSGVVFVAGMYLF